LRFSVSPFWLKLAGAADGSGRGVARFFRLRDEQS